jgi:protein-disulfide isomerase
MTAGCRAQTSSLEAAPVAASTAVSPAVSAQDRKIEVLIRSQFNVPINVSVTIGPTANSDIPGYRSLPVTFSRAGKASTVGFLLSDDGNTIARLEKFDIANNPANAIPTENRPIRGNPQAKVTIISFDDLECPYCASMHEELFPAAAEHYRGLVKFVYKDYPLTDIHPWAMHAAVDSNCLAQQNGDAYWSFVDYVHAHRDAITGAGHDPQASFKELDRIAREQGEIVKLDSSKLDACLAKQDTSAIRASMEQGDKLNITGTPALFIDGERIPGLVSQPVLWTAIDRALTEEGVTPPPEDQPNKPAQPATPTSSSPPGK